MHGYLRSEQVPKDIEIKEWGATSQIAQVQGQCGRTVDNRLREESQEDFKNLGLE